MGWLIGSGTPSTQHGNTAPALRAPPRLHAAAPAPPVSTAQHSREGPGAETHIEALEKQQQRRRGREARAAVLSCCTVYFEALSLL